jgi:Type VI secretion system VasI, EvfG, VC_A0118
MRILLSLACAGCVVALGAAGQFARAQGQFQVTIKDCLQIQDDADRLKCYDRVAIGAGANNNSPGAAPAWEVTDQRSPLDDSPLVNATMPSADGRASLLLRCKDRKTDVAVAIRGFTKCGGDVRVIYRVDQNPSADAPWKSSSTCYLAIAPQPIPFLRALNDESKVYFRLYDHNGATHDAEFNVGKVSDIRTRLSEACAWDAAAKPAATPAPTPAPAPTDGGAAPKATPKAAKKAAPK